MHPKSCAAGQWLHWDFLQWNRNWRHLRYWNRLALGCSSYRAVERKKPTWKEVGETEISASLRYYDVLNISSMKKQWISSRKNCGRCFKVQISQMNTSQPIHCCNYIRKAFWEKALYLSVDDDIAGTSRTVFRVTQNENTRKITVSCRKNSLYPATELCRSACLQFPRILQKMQKLLMQIIMMSFAE